jgi:hypothetical protein
MLSGNSPVSNMRLILDAALFFPLIFLYSEHQCRGVGGFKELFPVQATWDGFFILSGASVWRCRKLQGALSCSSNSVEADSRGS